MIRPVSPKSLPVVLFLYNYTYDTDVFRADRWCDRARQNGFAVAGFASALSPSRIRAPRPLKQWFVSQLQEALPQTKPGQAPPVLDRFPNLAAEAQALGPNGVLGWFHQQLGRLEHSRAGETDL